MVKGLAHGFGICVDDVLMQQQIVIKTIGDDIKNKEGFMGAAIMGDGKPAFILDVYEIFKKDFQESKGYQKLMNLNKAA